MSTSAGVAKDPVDYVDCFIGTDSSRWMLYPGPSMPFGMVKLSPDNQDAKWKAGYEYAVPNVAGFSHIHSWVMAGLLLQPCVGPLQTNPGPEQDPDAGYRSRIDKASETATPGYYAVTLEDYGVRAELTSTTRTGFHRYTFPESNNARVLLDLAIPAEYPYDVEWASVTRTSDREIAGFSNQRTYDGFSEMTNDYTVYFVIRFDSPFKSFNGWRHPCRRSDPRFARSRDHPRRRSDSRSRRRGRVSRIRYHTSETAAGAGRDLAGQHRAGPAEPGHRDEPASAGTSTPSATRPAGLERLLGKIRVEGPTKPTS